MRQSTYSQGPSGMSRGAGEGSRDPERIRHASERHPAWACHTLVPVGVVSNGYPRAGLTEHQQHSPLESGSQLEL